MRYWFSFKQKIWEIINSKKKGAQIFMFHQVSNSINTWKDQNISITKDSFNCFINTLLEKGFVFHALDELDIHTKKQDVYITFDDIFQDVIDNAIPLLEKKKIPFCVFVSIDLIDQKGYITFSQLDILKKNPLCSIGYHSYQHSLMRFISNEKKATESNPEPFENIIGKPILYYAFPYGSFFACDNKGIKIAQAYPYRYMFSTVRMRCNRNDLRRRRGFLPRININERNYKRYIK